jgi:hypothetical protein
MDNKTINLRVDEPSTEIVLVELNNSNDFIINYSSDIDFTDLVRTLSNMIDENCELLLNIEQDDYEGKLSLVISTIKSIFDKYNETLTHEFESETNEVSDDLPF